MKQLLIDGNYLVESFPYSNVLPAVKACMDMFLPDIVNIYWGSDILRNSLAGYKTNRNDWLPFCSEMVKGMTVDEMYSLKTPIRRRTEFIPDYLPEFGFYKKDIGYIGSMNMLSKAFTRIYVPEYWAFGYEVRDLIFSELVNADMLGIETAVVGRYLYAPYIHGNMVLYDFDKTYDEVKLKERYGFSGGKLLTFFSLTRNSDIASEYAKALVLENTDVKDILVKLKDNAKALVKYTENQSVLCPFFLKGLFGYQNCFTKNFDETFTFPDEGTKAAFKSHYDRRIALATDMFQASMRKFAEDKEKKVSEGKTNA